jgi:hypothetical protein
MKFLKALIPACLMLATATVPAMAQQVIVSPTNGEQVSSPFTLNMWANYCASLPVSAVGYSLDSSSVTSSWPTWYINGPVAAPGGWHTLHVKVWNNRGGICVTDISIDVTGGSSSSSSSGGSSGNSVVPWYAISISSIQALGNWISIHDGGTPGWSSGTTYVTGTPSLSGGSRLFANEFSDFGGQRFSSQFAGATSEHNFLYDAWVYIANDSNGFSNLEFDLNQTLTNGLTTIMGFQCDTWNNTWDFAVNGGSPTKPWSTWGHSGAYCNAHTWGANQWHHVQIYYTRNDSGWVTYHTVWLDGRAEGINVTAFSGFELGWGPSLVTNFQIDGSSSGTTWGNVYLDKIAVYRWD